MTAKPDPRERLTWWPKGYCSGWDAKKKACESSPCRCVKKAKPKAPGAPT